MSRIEQLAADLTAHGVTAAFGVPGSGLTLSLIDALERRGVPFVLTHFEGTGALMAATIGRLRGRAGLSVSIKGPGLTNAMPGLAAAHFEAFPLVHLAEATAPGAPAAQAHKRIDQAALTATVTKASRYLEDSGAGFAAAAALAEAEEPGPVLLEFAERAPGDQAPLATPASHPRGSSEAIAMVRAASRPVVIAGSLAARRKWGPLLARLDVPVFTTAAAKGLMDETLPHAAGVYTGVGLSLTPERQVLGDADLVVGLGLTAREVLSAKPFDVRAINIDTGDTPGIEGFAFVVRADPGAIDGVIESLGGASWGVDSLRASLGALDARMAEGHLPGSVFFAIDRRFAGAVRMVMDTGYFCTIGEHAWRARRDDLCLLAGQSRYMGTGLPMALGAAYHDRSTPAVAVLGDGGVGMYLAEAKLAAQHRLPLLIVLMTDNSFSSIRQRSVRDGLTQKPLIMDGRSWVPVFDGLGIPGTRAETPAAVDAALAAWNPAAGPAYLEVPFDPEAYARMVADIRG